MSEDTAINYMVRAEDGMGPEIWTNDERLAIKEARILTKEKPWQKYVIYGKRFVVSYDEASDTHTFKVA